MSKLYRNAFENIIYNIAEVDFPDQWQQSLGEIEGRLKQSDENLLISGLTALKNVMEAYEYQVEEERGPLNNLVSYFFPVLEQHMQSVMN